MTPNKQRPGRSKVLKIKVFKSAMPTAVPAKPKDGKTAVCRAGTCGKMRQNSACFIFYLLFFNGIML
jgi:hypothetical protein